jgi:hypothetical protein
MAKLIIKRTSDWTNIMRDLGIYLDGKKIGVIGNGELKEFDIEQGEHTLKSKIDWCGSETLNITVTDNENKKIELSGFKLGKFILPIILIISVIYHLTLGRNKYLRFEEK